MTVLRLTMTALILALAGCGQSGPLYLPGNPSEVQVPEGQRPPAQESRDDEEDKQNDGG